MRATTLIICGLVMAGMTGQASGHGHPIIVTQSDNRLVVSGGVAGTANGFASQIYVETDSAGDPQDYFEPAGFGPAIYWTVPGLNILGLQENSGLYWQTISRPVRISNPVEARTLWYWDPSSPADHKVELAPSDARLQIRHTGAINIVLTPTTYVAPPQIKIADPVAADMGFHNHDLLRYLLPYPLPADGAYGFFAKLTSNVYAPSDPFLVVINNGALSGPDMLAAAAAINHEALLAGDYNHDDRVDAADYVVWRKALNSTTQLAADGSLNGIVDMADLTVWRGNFGATFPASGSGSGSGFSLDMVPEPTGWGLCLFGAGILLITYSLGGCRGPRRSGRLASR